MTSSNDNQGPDDSLLRIALDHVVALEGHPGWTILMAELSRQYDEALGDLATVDGDDRAAIESMQRKCARFTWFRDTLRELIATGDVREDQDAIQEEDEV